MKTQKAILKPLCIALLASAISACATTGSEQESSSNNTGKLPACSSAPHCVSSDAVKAEVKPGNYVEPFVIKGLPYIAWDEAVNAIASTERTSIVEQRQGYLQAEVVSPWKFYTDDLELRLDQSQQIIHVRSSSRIGYYDFGVNRERVERLRGLLLAKGVIKG